MPRSPWRTLRGDFRLPAPSCKRRSKRLHRPRPRVALGQGLIGVASSAIDVSDGLVADLGHIAERSGVRAVIEWESDPAVRGSQRHRQQPLVQRCALAGGDDYELASRPASRRGELDVLAGRLGVALTRIGRIEPGQE